MRCETCDIGRIFGTKGREGCPECEGTGQTVIHERSLRASSQWESSDPYNMGTYITTSKMKLTEDEARLVTRALEEGHTWSVYKLHELNVLCIEARGWLRARSAPYTGG